MLHIQAMHLTMDAAGMSGLDVDDLLQPSVTVDHAQNKQKTEETVVLRHECDGRPNSSWWACTSAGPERLLFALGPFAGT